MKNPYLDRIASRRIGHAGRVSEKRVAGLLGARLQPASGALPGAKGDSRLDTLTAKYRIESKSTTASSMKFEKVWLDKISREAIHHQQIPLVTISFVRADGTAASELNPDWVMMPRHVFQELIDAG